ncbi:endonuclease domain-containing protein [Marivirga sp. S37H4]|uniref:Endonuclease domain-containing protein n=1 Tax=Marivirga aurantiaca TaxID=2802615 RepID=A0A934WWS9_9BACT|nr:DUF559 domain-containing protein [Marivirga aurantiaca]MBK6264377.1 endonuclease domain-containing protein [Marivirga aurantiaca]
MKKPYSNYNKKLKPFARELRTYGTPGEAVLWKNLLSRKQFYGYQFNRQFPIDNFIVDFICRKLHIVIELDGKSHEYKQEEDRQRDLILKELGFTVIRFSEFEVHNDMNNVIRTLEAYLPESMVD